MSQIRVIINPKTAEVTYHVEGVLGEGCTDLTRALVGANEEVEKQLTAEYAREETLPDFVTD